MSGRIFTITALMLAAIPGLYQQVQAPVKQSDQNSSPDIDAVLNRASKEATLDGAAQIMAVLLIDEVNMSRLFNYNKKLDERSMYIIFSGCWGSRARVSYEKQSQLFRICTESISANPTLIEKYIRAQRYATYFAKREDGGIATINSWTRFELANDIDDIMEICMESLRKYKSRPAEPVVSPFDKLVLVPAEEVELGLLVNWQFFCGITNHFDLIDKTTTKNWRSKFSDLDDWYRLNRAYVLWDNERSRITIDEDAKERARPTYRSLRSVPELKPPWIP
jgi:hypothetical protein